MSLAAAEVFLGLVAIGRARERTGSDYYIGLPGMQISPVDGELDYEEAFRLEVSGIDRCEGDADLRRRVTQKVQQLRAGKSSLPGIAGVVAFSLRRIVLRKA